MVSNFNIFVWKLSKIAAQKKVFSSSFWFCLTKHGGNHASRWIRDLWSKGISLILAYIKTFLSFCIFDDFFRFSKYLGFGYSWSTLLWYRCYYPHRSRDALSPVCGIFFWIKGFLNPWFIEWFKCFTTRYHMCQTVMSYCVNNLCASLHIWFY